MNLRLFRFTNAYMYNIFDDCFLLVYVINSLPATDIGKIKLVNRKSREAHANWLILNRSAIDKIRRFIQNSCTAKIFDNFTDAYYAEMLRYRMRPNLVSPTLSLTLFPPGLVPYYGVVDIRTISATAFNKFPHYTMIGKIIRPGQDIVRKITLTCESGLVHFKITFPYRKITLYEKTFSKPVREYTFFPTLPAHSLGPGLFFEIETIPNDCLVTRQHAYLRPENARVIVQHPVIFKYGNMRGGFAFIF